MEFIGNLTNEGLRWGKRARKPAIEVCSGRSSLVCGQCHRSIASPVLTPDVSMGEARAKCSTREYIGVLFLYHSFSLEVCLDSSGGSGICQFHPTYCLSIDLVDVAGIAAVRTGQRKAPLITGQSLCPNT